jgi:uncharacterized protein (DUF362 family)/NAD-dependent dihydropyrimidine dehydrogenase PreA subunit
LKDGLAQRSLVALACCDDYAHSDEAVRSVLELLGGSNPFRSKRVLLKVNVMKGADPSRAVNTHPEIVAALVRLVRESGGEALVGDSSGVLGCTDEAFEASGIAEATRRAGGTLVNFDACKLMRLHLDGKVLREAWVPRILFDVDVVVTVPKLKTHTLLLLTAALKNQVGVLAGGQKCHLHEVAPRPGKLAHAILDLNAALPVRMAVVDAVVGLSGQGMRRAACAQKVGAVVAGLDLVAVDAVCARLVGMEPEEVLTCRYGQERGLGTCDLSRIDVRDPGKFLSRGSTRASFLRPGFEPKRIGAFARFFYRIRGRAVKPVLDRDRCDQCGRCAEVCPTGAISLIPYPEIGKGCILCFACHENCTPEAMRLRCHPLLRRSFRKRAADVDIHKLLS